MFEIAPPLHEPAASDAPVANVGGGISCKKMTNASAARCWSFKHAGESAHGHLFSAEFPENSIISMQWAELSFAPQQDICLRLPAPFHVAGLPVPLAE